MLEVASSRTKGTNSFMETKLVIDATKKRAAVACSP